MRPRTTAWTAKAPLAGDGPAPARLARLSLFGFGTSALATSFTVVFLPARVEELAPEGAKNTYLGVLSFAALVIAIATQPIVGGISDRVRTRWGRRAPFILGGSVASAPLIVFAGVAPSYALLFVLVGVLSLASNSALGPYQGLVRDLVPARHRGAASGMKTATELAGAVVVTGVVGVLLGRYSATGNAAWVWGGSGLLALVLLAGAVATAHTLTTWPSGAAGPDPPPGPNEDAPTHPDFKWLLVALFLIALGAASLQTFLLFYLRDVVGIANPAGQVWKIVAVAGLTAVLVAYPAGVLADLVGRKPVMAAAGVIGASATVLLLGAQSLTGLIILSGVAGVAIGMFRGAHWAMAADMVSARRTAQELALLNLVTTVGAGLARLNGVWVDALNARSDNLGYSALIVLCGILFLAGTLLILGLRSQGEPIVTQEASPEDRFA